MRTRPAMAIVLSVLVHALLLLMFSRYRDEMPVQPGNTGQEPLVVQLIPPTVPAPAPQASVIPPPQSHPVRRKRAAVPRSAKPAADRQALPAVVVTPAPEPVPMDMSTMINAARERRRAAEDAAARENAEAVAGLREPSSNDIAMANIQHSLQAQSARRAGGGVFQVLSKGARTGRFLFRGWAPGARDTTQQTFEVDAGPDGDVELALVRRMIQLIRSHYSGDFNWESRRLGRIMVQSARIEDNAELEAFLMKEFFPAEVSFRR